MNPELQKSAAKETLDHVMSLFPRVDTSLSLVFGVDIGMLALLAANAPSLASFQGFMIFAAIPVLLLGCSLWQIYHGVFPRLEGSQRSLIYFREIASRTQSDFFQEFKTQSDEVYINGVLAQLWANSQILTQKYQHLKQAFIFLAWSLVPWLVTLGAFAAVQKYATSLLAK